MYAPPKHRLELALGAKARPRTTRETPARRSPKAHDCWFVRYLLSVAFEATLQEALKMSADDRAELIERLIDSLDNNEVDLSAEELTALDDALVDADRAAERGELIPCDDVLSRMRQIL